MLIMFNIVLIGDLHIKDKTDLKFVQGWMKKHLDRKSDRLILIGDLIDTGLDRGMQWNQDNVNKQVLYLKKLLEPYTILGYVLGNHERRIVDKVGLNPYQLLLGDETTEYSFENGKVLCIQHGKSGAQNQGLELARLSQVVPHADFVALGHTHELGIYSLPHGVIGLRTGSLQKYPKYAERSIMIPKTMGCIRYLTQLDTFQMVIEKEAR